ncbi:Abi family protein [Nocardia panacis]|uniref:Abi family protein n=1 Tax=Nocardia panacis TaxID=2340916 RepID=A0A3A4KTT8_9NOCA|nr:Abi family protein [Nocardia panacis]RJO79796.1 Abi family protein [Nocardia panacis]
MKPFLSVTEQVNRLRDNGLALREDESVVAEHFLRDHNYYRVSGSFRYFQVNPPAGLNQFRSESSFEKIRTAYEFDRRLAQRLQSGLAEFEIVFRSQLAYLMARSAGPTSYLDEQTYDDKNGARDRLLQDIRNESRRSNERFVQHHSTLGEPMPIWAAVEVMSFGTTSKMYGLVKDAEGVFKPLAARFGISHRASRRIFRAMTVLRNVCAHHGRISNRNHRISLEAPRELQQQPDKTIYKDTPWAWVLTLGHLVDNVRANHDYSESLWDFLEAEPEWLCKGLIYPSEM